MCWWMAALTKVRHIPMPQQVDATVGCRIDVFSEPSPVGWGLKDGRDAFANLRSAFAEPAIRVSAIYA